MVIGIDIQIYFSFDIRLIWMIFIAVIGLLFTLNRLKKNTLFSIVCAIGFSLVGTLLVGEQKNGSSETITSSETIVVKVLEISSKESIWRKAICQITGEDSNFSKLDKNNVLLFFESDAIQTGDVVIASTKLERIKNKNNPGEFDAEKYWKAKSIDLIGFVGEGNYQFIDHIDQSRFSVFFESLRNFMSNVLSEHLSEDKLAVANALVLGDKDFLSAETRKSFASAGAMHVLAVSGLHVGIVLVLLMFFFKQFPRVFSKNRALIAALLVIWCYAGLTGLSPSVLRATIMFTILSFSTLIGRKGNNVNTLFFSAFVMLVWEPMYLFDIGFQLSYLAMIGIFIFHQPISRMFFIYYKPLKWLWEGTSVGIAAQIATFPLSLYYFHQFPNFFLLTNIGMMLLAGVCLSVGLLLSLVSKIGYLSNVVGYLTFLLFSGMLFFVQFIESIPGALAKGFIVSAEMVLLFYSVMLFILIFKEKKQIRFAGVLVLTLLIGVIQINRYKGYVRKELVVYNSNKLVLSINDGNEIHCFYDERGEGKVSHFLEDYEKIYPGNITYHKLKNGLSEYKTEGYLIQISQNEKGVNLKCNNEEYFIRNSYRNLSEDKIKIIDMPYLQENPNHIQLKYGAFRLRLN